MGIVLPAIDVIRSTSLSGTIIIGIACSLLAWDVVAIYDLLVETQAQFQIEKDDFCKKIQGIMEEINGTIKQSISTKNVDEFIKLLNQQTDKNEGLWKYIYHKIMDMDDYMELLPINQKIFILSSEYNLYKNYINRCFWLLLAHIVTDECDCAVLYKKFMIYEDETSTTGVEDITNFFNTINNHAMDIYKLKDIDLNEEPFRVPETILQERIGSVLCSNLSNDLSTKTNKKISFIPYVKFEKLMSKKYKGHTLMLDLLNINFEKFLPKKCKWYIWILDQLKIKNK